MILIGILVILGLIVGIKLLSKLILLFVGVVVVCALLSTVFVFLKAIVKLSVVVLCISIVVGLVKKYLLN